MPDPPLLPEKLHRTLMSGQVIPAHPLALTAERRLDETHQRALTRYYAAAGAGGIAVGVHTTQFAIRKPGVDLFKPVLELAIETIQAYEATHGGRRLRVAGVCGDTPQAVAEAAFARETGYDLGLLSLAALPDADEDRLILHCRAIAEVIPLFGFYLQPSVGGRVLSRDFWRRFVEIPGVAAIKIAPFNRYQTLDVIRAVAEVGRVGEIALYTGNDDHILLDLIATYSLGSDGRIGMAGGLLGHWSVWTRRAVEHLEIARHYRATGEAVPVEILELANAITDANAALFDPAHGFAGCIAGLHEVLRRQGLMRGTWCLDPAEGLSSGQTREIDRIYSLYPHLTDDEFVAEHREAWLR